MSVKLEIKANFPLKRIIKAVESAAVATTYAVAEEVREYMLKKFTEPKTGKRYYAPGLGWYTASAPGEYPAMRYGYLYTALEVTASRTDKNTIYAVITLDPASKANEYAEELETMRPYMRRAYYDTARYHEEWFRYHFNAAIERNQRPRGTGGETLGQIARDVAQGRGGQ